MFVFSLILINSDAFAQSEVQKKCIELNNEGVKALNRNDWRGAEKMFEQILELDPTYQIGKDNLSIVRSHFGFVPSIKELHAAAFNGGSRAQERLTEAIFKMKKNPADSLVREQLGDEAAKNGDREGAIVEYLQSVQLKDTPTVRRKLADEYTLLGDKREAELQLGVAKWTEQHNKLTEPKR